MNRILLIALLIISTHADLFSQCYSTDLTKCCGVNSIDQCPVEGCRGDANLTRRKNLTAIPDPAIVEDWSFNDMLYVLFPESWTRGADRSLLTSWGEGKAIRLKVRIQEAKPSGHETPNCH